MEEELIKIVKENALRQFKLSDGKNLFCLTGKPISFSERTKNNIKIVRQNKEVISDTEKESLINFLVAGFIKYCVKINQYINFKKKDYADIKKIYLSLFNEIVNTNLSDKELELKHFSRITELIKNTNPAIYNQNLNNNVEAFKTVCSEYSAEFQIDVLGININDLKTPVLDIGCGSCGTLVKYLLSKNIEAYGIDRLVKSNNNFKNTNWLEYNFGIEKWGTVISNISFSSHFTNHYFFNDNLTDNYTKTYLKILKSLKTGGKFIYAPAIFFIEKHLTNTKFKIENEKIDDVFYKTTITRQ
jgi:hypothetical protein